MATTEEEESRLERMHRHLKNFEAALAGINELNKKHLLNLPNDSTRYLILARESLEEDTSKLKLAIASVSEEERENKRLADLGKIPAQSK